MKIQKAKEDLAEAEKKQEQQYESMKVRIKYMYEQGDTKALEDLFTSNSIADFLNQAEIEFVQKDRLYELIRSERPAAGILSELFAMDISRDLRGVLVEILTAQIV